MKSQNLALTISIFFSLIILLSSCGNQDAKDALNQEEVQKMEAEFSTFIKEVEGTLDGLYKNSSLAAWNAYNSGKDQDFAISEEADIALNNYLANKEVFEKLKEFKESGLIQDTDLNRMLLLSYNAFLGCQIDTAKLNAVTLLSSDISKRFQNFRAKVDGKVLTDNDIENILATSKDSKKLEKTWLAHKEIGNLVAEDLIELVKMRNEVAKEIGFKNYHEMSLTLSEQDPEAILKLFDELDNLTRDSFKQLMDEMNDVIAKQCNIKPEELMPWHYQNRYFQEAPKIYSVDLDKYYKGKDLVELTKNYYASIAMPVDDIIAKSDLFEKQGKSQHAFCFDIDRSGDVRVLCNVRPEEKWMNTMLHEFGHGVYFKYVDMQMPWSFRTPAHTFTTEAIAMLFGRFAANPTWIKDLLGVPEAEVEKISETCSKILRLQQLVFSRWSQVMYRFEKSLYENPDQDLNKLWWDLVEQYQMIKRPAGRNSPDWATKMHIATSPCYYHNYHLGELLASQLYYTIKDKVLGKPDQKEVSFYNEPKVGEFLIGTFFGPGAKYYWDDKIEKSTGEKLTPKYYAKQFVE